MASQGYVYFGEAAGARIIRYGVGYTQVGGAYNLETGTWDFYPATDAGEGIFRNLVLTVRHTNGYNVSMQAQVDTSILPLATFNGGPPVAGLLEERATCRSWLMRRGKRLIVTLKTIQLLGETEFADLWCSYLPIRPNR